MKAGRNKTIDLSVEEGKSYLDRCISISKPTDLQSVINKTILGDTFSILPLLPTKFVDLLIADPPTTSTKTSMGKNSKKHRMKCTKSIPSLGLSQYYHYSRKTLPYMFAAIGNQVPQSARF